MSAAKARAIELAKEPQKLQEREVGIGAPGPGRGKKTDDYNHLFNPRGSSAPEYLTARIARDRPDILEKMRAGEYGSARAAAIEAGIIKPRQQFAVGESTQPLDFAKSLVKKCDRDFLIELTSALNGLLIEEDRYL